MPPHAQMHPEDPIINAVVLLESAPTREEVVKAIQPLFYFERYVWWDQSGLLDRLPRPRAHPHTTH